MCGQLTDVSPRNETAEAKETRRRRSVGPDSVALLARRQATERESRAGDTEQLCTATPKKKCQGETPFSGVAATTACCAVALALADGLSNQDIADRLGKTVDAVKFMLHRIYQKTGLPNRAALVAVLRSRPNRSEKHQR